MKRHLLPACLFCLLCLAGSAASPGAEAGSRQLAATPYGQRFLFIVDMSESMERLQSATEATVYDLLRGGVGGYMRAGDTYGLWTFNAETTTGRFPMQIWDPRKAGQQGTIAAAYLNGLNYENSSKVAEAMKTLQSVVHSASNLVVFLISDGASALRGTPVDKIINAEYKKKSRDRSRAKRPFVTTLIARDGWLIGGSVSIAGDPIVMPTRLDAPVAATAATAPLHGPTPPAARPVGTAAASLPPAAAATGPAVAAGTPAAAPPTLSAASPGSAVLPVAQTPVVPLAALAAAVPAEPAKPAPQKVMQIITHSNVADATNPEAAKPLTAATLAEPRAVVVPPVLPATNNVSGQAVASAPPVPPAGGAPVTTDTRAKATAQELRPESQLAATPAEAIGSEPGNGSKNPALEKGFVTLSPDPILVAARELNPAAETTRGEPGSELQALSVPAQLGLRGAVLLGFGVFLLIAVLFLAIVALRRFRPAANGSLITQSMDRR